MRFTAACGCEFVCEMGRLTCHTCGGDGCVCACGGDGGDCDGCDECEWEEADDDCDDEEVTP